MLHTHAMKAISAIILTALFLLTIGARSEPSKKAKDPIVGKWGWTGDQIVECLPDGTFKVSPTNRHGKWRVVPYKVATLKYEFTWDGGLFVDTLLMSRDQKGLSGKNQKKEKIEGTKIE
jgi:hypothetical protein